MPPYVDIPHEPEIMYRDITAYKYQTTALFQMELDMEIEHDIHTKYFSFVTIGPGKVLLTIVPGYAWDGPSGTTFDTAATITPSGVHDVGYQCLRMGELPQSFKPFFDQLLYDMFRERQLAFAWNRYEFQEMHWSYRPAARIVEAADKVWDWFRASYWHVGVKYGGIWASKEGFKPGDV